MLVVALLGLLIENGGVGHVSGESIELALEIATNPNGPPLQVERDLDTGYIIRIL